MSDLVKCADCGFLAVRKKVTRELVDAESTTREIGALDGERYDPYPICFVREIGIQREVGGNLTADRIKAVLLLERDCKSSTKWQQGLTPKEHYEMIANTRVAEIQAQQARDDRAFQADQARIGRRHNNWSLAVAIAGVAVAVASSFFSRRSPVIVENLPEIKLPEIRIAQPMPSATPPQAEPLATHY